MAKKAEKKTEKKKSKEKAPEKKSRRKIDKYTMSNLAKDLCAEYAGFTMSGMKELMRDALSHIRSSIVSGKRVSFKDFGSFTLKQRSARKGRNPKTGEEIKIAAKKVLKFKPAKTFKSEVASL